MGKVQDLNTMYHDNPDDEVDDPEAFLREQGHVPEWVLPNDEDDEEA